MMVTIWNRRCFSSCSVALFHPCGRWRKKAVTRTTIPYRHRSLSSSVAAAARSLRPFEIEQYEGWLAKVNLSDADSEPLMLKQLMGMADNECQQLWNNLSLGYPLHAQGDPLLRQEIASCFYPGFSIDKINCMAPQEGIFCALKALLEPGDHVVVTAPVYQSLSEVPRSVGCRLTHWLPDLVQEGDHDKSDPSFWFDPEKLNNLLNTSSSGTKAVIVNFPHNPTGAHPTRNEWNRIIVICGHHGCYLFCDEIYRGLEYDGVDILDPAATAYERGISMSGLSKIFGLAGLRMGWVVGQDPVFMQRVQEVKDYTTLCPPTPSQVLSIVALRNANELIGRCRKIVLDNVRGHVQNFCRQHDDILEWTSPRAGSFVFPKLLLLDQGAKSYCDSLMEKNNIMLLPSSLFEYGEHNKDDSRVRISLGRTSMPDNLQYWATQQGF